MQVKFINSLRKSQGKIIIIYPFFNGIDFKVVDQRLHVVT